MLPAIYCELNFVREIRRTCFCFALTKRLAGDSWAALRFVVRLISSIQVANRRQASIRRSLASVCGLWSSRANAQAVYGSILGTVTDPQGAAVAAAKVTVTDQNKGTIQTTATNDSGNYTVTHLIPDTYSVKVEAQGFKTSEQS